MSISKNLLRSWLRANKIPFDKSSVPGCDFTVQGRMGDIEVRLCERKDETAPGANVVDVLASDITHKKLDVAFAAYHRITEAAGFGKPVPVDRGPQPAQKLCYTDEPFLVCVRHSAYRRSPNPSPEKYTAYDTVMHKACWNFYGLNQDTCRRWGQSVEDLRTVAMVLLAIFCSQIEDDEKSVEDNEQTLYVWLRQRFAEIFKIESQKERSTMPDADTVSIALLGKAYRGRMEFDSDGDAVLSFEYHNDPRAAEGEEDFGLTLAGSLGVEQEDREHKKRNRKLNTSNPTTRKKSAKDALETGLANLGHDGMVYALGFAHQNILINSDARREAGKRLKAHVAECSECQETIKSIFTHAKTDDAKRAKAHAADCESCHENRFLVAASTEVDVDEEAAAEALGSEE